MIYLICHCLVILGLTCALGACAIGMDIVFYKFDVTKWFPHCIGLGIILILFLIKYWIVKHTGTDVFANPNRPLTILRRTLKR